MENKVAQGLGWKNWIKEKADIIEWTKESLSNEYREFMDELRMTDSLVRSKAKTLKSDLENSKTLFKRKEYISFYIPLTRYYNTNKQIYTQLKSLKNELLEDQYKMLSSKLQEKDIGLLKDLSKTIEEYKSKKASKTIDKLVKEAGMFADMAKFLKRRWELQGLEKRHKAFFTRLQKDGDKILDEAEKLFDNLKTNFDKMAKSRVGREISSYLEAVRDYITKFESFETKFVAFYDSYISQILARISEREDAERKAKELEEDKVSVPASFMQPKKESPQIPDLDVPKKVVQEIPIETPSHPEAKPEEVESKKVVEETPTSEEYKFEEDEEDDENVSEEDLDRLLGPKVKAPPLKMKSNIDFINKLYSCSSKEDLINEIKKYSNSLQKEDLQTSLKLLAIIEE